MKPTTELTVPQAADATGISRRLLWRLLVDGRVTGHQTSSRRWMVDASMLPRIVELRDQLQRYPTAGPRPRCSAPGCVRWREEHDLCRMHMARVIRDRQYAQRAAEIEALATQALTGVNS